MKVWYISSLLLSFLLIEFSYSQVEMNWGWNGQKSSTYIDPEYFKNRINKMDSNSAFSRLIFYYKKNVSPKQGPRCPCFPSCSTFTLYSMQKYGFFWGFIMGVERIYFRETLDITYRINYFPVMVNGKEKVYDPPEANYIFEKKDWRIINPIYFNNFYK